MHRDLVWPATFLSFCSALGQTISTDIERAAYLHDLPPPLSFAVSHHFAARHLHLATRPNNLRRQPISQPLRAVWHVQPSRTKHYTVLHNELATRNGLLHIHILYMDLCRSEKRITECIRGYNFGGQVLNQTLSPPRRYIEEGRGVVSRGFRGHYCGWDGVINRKCGMYEALATLCRATSSRWSISTIPGWARY